MGVRSFGLVDLKVAEADFFLEKAAHSNPHPHEIMFYLSAFAAASRSITFSLQSVLSDLEGFDEWYENHKAQIKNDSLSKFFNDFRRVTQHVGNNYGMAGRFIIPTKDIPTVPNDDDIITAGRKYLKIIVAVVFDGYIKYGPYIDAQQRYTMDFFNSIGKTIGDAEEECGFPRGWTDTGDENFTQHRWQALRDSQPGCEIHHLFKKYLGKCTPTSKRVY